jgi:hypothetical protein
MSTLFKGLRTVLFNALIAAIAAVLTYLIGVDWTQYVSPTAALVIVGAANIGLRAITDTAMGKKL